MTLIDWRNSGERRSLAMDVLNNPTVREMLAVMAEEQSALLFTPLRDGFDASLNIGILRGYQLALNSFRAFAEPLPQAQEAIQETWNASLPDEPKKP